MSALPESEFEARTVRAQALMAQNELGALLLTSEPDVRYFTGYLTRFWESPCRPWFLIVPASGKPIAVIPSIGAALMSKTWVEDIRTWSAPNPEDDGISVLAETLREVGGPVGIPSGAGFALRMPLSDYATLHAALGRGGIGNDHGIMRALRLVKSEAEIALIRRACAIATSAFARVGEIARVGVPMAQVFRDFQCLCLEEGADWVPYLAGGAGPLGYDDVISPADATPLANGDILMLDTGLVHQGYFCDFDRNFAIGRPDPRAEAAWDTLLEATEAGAQAAVVGATAADVFHAMDKIVTGGAGTGDAGRLGHGLGMQLTEAPSLIAGDQTVLHEGMVLTLEPGVFVEGGALMVHEENIVIRQKGCEFLSSRAAGPLPRLV